MNTADIYDNIIVAHEQINSFARRTPFIYSPSFSNDLDCEVYLMEFYNLYLCQNNIHLYHIKYSI